MKVNQAVLQSRIPTVNIYEPEDLYTTSWPACHHFFLAQQSNYFSYQFLTRLSVSQLKRKMNFTHAVCSIGTFGNNVKDILGRLGDG